MNPLVRKTPHSGPKAKRVIYLFQSGGPSQIEIMITNRHSQMAWSGNPTIPKKTQRNSGMVKVSLLSSCKINL